MALSGSPHRLEDNSFGGFPPSGWLAAFGEATWLADVASKDVPNELVDAAEVQRHTCGVRVGRRDPC